MDATSQNKSMLAWMNDAAGVRIGAHDTPYLTAALKQYIKEPVGSSKRILVAPKGYGKTLFLKYKSHVVRTQQANGIATFPNSPGMDVEYLKLSADLREMQGNVARLSVDSWSLLWQFVLICKGLQMIQAVPENDKYLAGLLGLPSMPVGELLTETIRDSDNFSANTSSRLGAVRRYFMDAGKDAIIFIENVDEMFVGLDRTELHRIRTGDVPSSKRVRSVHATKETEKERREQDAETSNQNAKANPSMWKAAQVGLLLAVREIERSVGRLCVYSTLRAEALSGADHGDVVQAKSYIVPIKYSREDLVQIFAWHVDRMDHEDLVSPAAEHAAERLLGTSAIPHRYVKSVRGEAEPEHSFDLILRHTTYSPRDLVVIGGHLAGLSTAQRAGEDRTHGIREAIDAASAELMTYFKNNSVPEWKDEWTNGIVNCKSAVMDAGEVKKAFGENAARLYAFGLLGYSQLTAQDNQFRQVFLTRWDDGYGTIDRPLEKASHYFLHPWLHDLAKKVGQSFELDRFNIIGSGRLYLRPPSVFPIALIRDANNAPSISLGGGAFDSPTAGGKTLTQDAAFFFAYLLACSIVGSREIDRDALQLGRASFNEKFPSYSRAVMIDPFKDDYQASHMKRKLRECFPSLGHAVAGVGGDYGRLAVQGKEKTIVRASFVDVSQLTVEC